MASNTEIVLKLTDICKNYGNKRILKNLSFEVKKGEIIGFLGPNGAGKSTTIKIISRLVAPTSGTIELNGTSITNGSAADYEKLGVMFETPSFYSYLSAYQNLDILRRLSKKNGADVHEALSISGLASHADVKVREFSQGMRQRLGIAQAILTKPELLILDEPTNALDPAGRKEMKALIKDLSRKYHITIFLSSHLLAEIEQVCSRVIIISHGEIVTSKTMDELESEGITSLEDFFMELTQ
jgi:ABC-2 type transport system ATP-binding protein